MIRIRKNSNNKRVEEVLPFDKQGEKRGGLKVCQKKSNFF